MGKQENPYPLRLNAELSKKLKHLAQADGRSFNKEVEFILKQFMAQYEAEHGPVSIEE